jgi:hypothetical protein
VYNYTTAHVVATFIELCFLKCGLYNTYNTCIIHFGKRIIHILYVLYSSHLFTVSNKTYYTRIIHIIQPTFQKFIKHSSIHMLF